MERAEKLIGVMTPEEKCDPQLLFSKPSSQTRLRRIAKDAGVKLSEASVSCSRADVFPLLTIHELLSRQDECHPLMLPSINSVGTGVGVVVP